MLDLDELQRLAEGAKACVPPETQWFHVGDLQIMLNAHLHEAEFVHAMSPDTAKKLIAVARAAQAALKALDALEYYEAPEDVIPSGREALRTALEELK